MKIDSPFFTIIMPVYNSQNTVGRAVKSLQNQIFDNFQLIIIDDHSTDDSLAICQELANGDSRINVLQTKVNGGAAAARNYGLPYANGIYITFCDSDDYVDNDLLDTAYQYLKSEEVDCLKYGCIEEYYNPLTNRRYQKIISVDTQRFVGKEKVIRKCLELEQLPLFGYMCNGFYKSQIIKDYHLTFNEAYRVNEDFEFNIQYFNYVEHLQCIAYYGYHYIKEVASNSLSSQNKDDYYKLHMLKIRKFIELFGGVESIDRDSMKKLFWLYTRFIYSTLQRAYANHQNINSVFQKIKEDDLYPLFCKVDFNKSTYKQKILTELLRQNNRLLLMTMVSFIGYIREKAPFLFARIKG